MAVIRLGNLLWKDNTQPNSVNNPVNTKDVNSDDVKGELVAVRNELQLVKDELEAVKEILTDGSQKVQQSGIEGRLEQVRALLQNVSDKDFAKDETLEQARALLNTLSAKDFATSSNQDALKTVVDDLKSELLLVKSELDNIKQNQTSGDQKVQLSGTIVSVLPSESMEVAAGAKVLVFEDDSGLFSKAMFLVYPTAGQKTGKLFERYRVGLHSSAALEREIPVINRGDRILTEQPYPLLSPHWVRIYWENTTTDTQTISRSVTWFYGR